MVHDAGSSTKYWWKRRSKLVSSSARTSLWRAASGTVIGSQAFAAAITINLPEAQKKHSSALAPMAGISTLARAVGALSYEETPTLTCWYFSYWSGVPTEGFEWHLRKNRA